MATCHTQVLSLSSVRSSLHLSYACHCLRVIKLKWITAHTSWLVLRKSKHAATLLWHGSRRIDNAICGSEDRWASKIVVASIIESKQSRPVQVEIRPGCIQHWFLFLVKRLHQVAHIVHVFTEVSLIHVLVEVCLTVSWGLPVILNHLCLVWISSRFLAIHIEVVQKNWV